MSIEAVAWALNTADVADATEVLVLIGIANHANRDGRNSWANQATLARYARCSDRTVRRKLAALEERGVIARGDQRAVDHIAGPVRPVVWDLIWPGQNGRPGHSVRTSAAGGPDVAVSGQSGHGSVLSGRSRMAVEPLTEPLTEPKEEPKEEGRPGFDDFWAAYPLRTAKMDALKAWAKALKAADPAAIIAGAVRYAADPNRDPKFTAFPATWLNHGRWDDDPLPAAAAGRDRGADILAGERAAAVEADARRAAAAAGRELTAGGSW